MLTDITEHQVEVLATENVMTPELQAAFRRVLDQKVQISKLQSETGTRQMELSAINTDQMRIRENMKALRGSVEEKALLLRYTHQLNWQEDRLTLLHKEITELEQKQNAERQNLRISFSTSRCNSNSWIGQANRNLRGCSCSHLT